MFAEGYNYEEEPVSEVTRRRLEFMISVALLTPNEKLKYEKQSIFISEEEANKVIEELKQIMPIMGLHNWPLDMRQQAEAIKYQVAKDDLHEERWRK